jgi:hypothetical protein
VCRRLRDGGGGRGVLLVALTGQSDDESHERSEKAGFAYHLTKPVSVADLERVLLEMAVPTVPVPTQRGGVGSKGTVPACSTFRSQACRWYSRMSIEPTPVTVVTIACPFFCPGRK